MKTALQQEDARKSRKPYFTLGTFGLSVTVHVVLFLFIGGVVITETIIPKVKLVGEVIPSETVVDEMVPEESKDTPDSPTDTLLAPAEATPAAPAEIFPSVVTTESISPVQNLLPPTAVVTSTSVNTGNFAPEGGGANPGKGPKGTMKMTSLFGTTEDTGTGLTGYLYDLKQSRSKKPISTSPDVYRAAIADFIKDWDPNKLREYYRSREPLFIAQILIPNMDAKEAPKAFGVEKEVQPRLWFAHYQGKVKAPRSGTFRFLGKADDIIVVALDKKIVLDGSLARIVPGTEPIDGWFEMKHGEEKTIDVVIGEQPGGSFRAYLSIQSKKDIENKELPAVVQFAPTELPADLTKMQAPLSKKPFVFDQ